MIFVGQPEVYNIELIHRLNQHQNAESCSYKVVPQL
jgi:hypothetical protein